MDRGGLKGCFCPVVSGLPKGCGDPGGRHLASKTLCNSAPSFIKGSFIPLFCRNPRQNSQSFQQPDTSLTGKAPMRGTAGLARFCSKTDPKLL